MASFFRRKIAQKVISLIQNRQDVKVPISANSISSRIIVNKYSSPQPELIVPWSKIEHVCDETKLKPKELVKLLRNQGLPTAEGFIDIQLSESPHLSLVFAVDKHVFSKIVLNDIIINEDDLCKNSCLFEDIKKMNIVVQSNFPAFGERCLMTHFRTAIHSQFVTNINRYVGHNVVKIGHLNDWGRDAAILLTGYNHFKIGDESNEKSTLNLFEVMKSSLFNYVNDKKFNEKVQLTLQKMEKGDLKVKSEWQDIKHACMSYYNSVYKRIGVNFDAMHFDSTSFEEAETLCFELLDKNIIIEADGGIKINISEEEERRNSYSDPRVITNCDSQLYHLSRCLNAAIEMKKNYNFDRMYYVGPSSHKDFNSVLFNVLKKLDYPWAGTLRQVNLQLISEFESKRRAKRNIEDVLDKVKQGMVAQLQKNLQIEWSEELEEMAEQLGLSSLIVHDMKHHRKNNYRFDLEEIINFRKETGASFQLCHAGLKGVQEDSEYKFQENIDTSPLLEKEAIDLIIHLARFDDMVYKSYIVLEPVVMYHYLISLWYYTDRAIEKLKLDIKEDRLIVIKARLMLLSAAMKVFAKALYIIGIIPMENIYTPEQSSVQNN